MSCCFLIFENKVLIIRVCRETKEIWKNFESSACMCTSRLLNSWRLNLRNFQKLKSSKKDCTCVLLMWNVPSQTLTRLYRVLILWDYVGVVRNRDIWFAVTTTKSSALKRKSWCNFDECVKLFFVEENSVPWKRAWF